MRGVVLDFCYRSDFFFLSSLYILLKNFDLLIFEALQCYIRNSRTFLVSHQIIGGFD